MSKKTKMPVTNHREVLQVAQTLICSGTAKMIMPQGGAHVRQVELRLPRFKSDPAISTTIFSMDSPGNAFAVWSVVMNYLGNQTQIVISACNVQTGQPVPFEYFCSYVIIGQAE